ncbi:ATP-binding protein [Kitasatospora sp. NPDC048538]|uniref:ATP-binding response regulator n=1 Tax=unclassified Kitasatospora TaxID=2633591 RepID=UPI0033DD560B
MTGPEEPQVVRLGTVPVASAQDGFALRRIGKSVAELLGSDGQDAIRLATALSEISRDMLGSGRLTTHFDLCTAPGRVLSVTVDWHGSDGPSADALNASARLLPTSHGPADGGGWVRLDHRLPAPTGEQPDGAEEARRLLDAHGGPADPDDFQAQTQDLIAALERTRAQSEELKRLNDELAETNRGVVALYAELSEELEETNRGVVALYAELDEKSRQLREASEAKTRFWANVSHELRTPVNSVVGLAELLLADADAPATERGHRLSLIADSGRTLLALVDELLDVAKAESGNLEPSWAPMDLHAVLAQLDGTLRGLARPGVTLSVTADADPGPILGDETMLARILRNLLSNALKFTEAGSVRLTAHLDGTGGAAGPGELVLTVSDTGIGIPADQHARVFEEFYQVKGPHQRGRHGTGLGLPYARRLVGLLGGTMHLESSPGSGTTITVRLPAAPAPGPGVLPRAARLVVVDDDAAFRAVLRPLLRDLTDHVVEVPDSGDALATLRRERPDALILDLHMSGLDGYAVLARLRGDPDLHGLPVVVLTSADPSSLDRDRLTHARSVLQKSGLTAGRLSTALSTAIAPPNGPLGRPLRDASAAPEGAPPEHHVETEGGP